MAFFGDVFRVLLGGTTMMVIGCGTGGAGANGKPSEAALTSTKIEFTARYNIEQAILTVFQLDGFQESGRAPGRLRFMKVGDRESQALYGEWFVPGEVVEVEVMIREVEFGTHLVECKVTVQKGGIALPDRKGRFRTLMKRVKKLAGVL
ncbi:MAG: hypothetical protein ABGZ49_11535 [Akkermansiaceae bacterium]|jgi:hypothetical protein